MKKLLLPLLCVPLIGWSQDISFDEIIFSNGDTIYGDVIEVGVNEIIYKHTLPLLFSLQNSHKFSVSLLYEKTTIYIFRINLNNWM